MNKVLKSIRFLLLMLGSFLLLSGFVLAYFTPSGMISIHTLSLLILFGVGLAYLVSAFGLRTKKYPIFLKLILLITVVQVFMNIRGTVSLWNAFPDKFSIYFIFAFSTSLLILFAHVFLSLSCFFILRKNKQLGSVQ